MWYPWMREKYLSPTPKPVIEDKPMTTTTTKPYPWTVELGSGTAVYILLSAQTFKDALTIAMNRTKPGSYTHETRAEIFLEGNGFRKGPGRVPFCMVIDGRVITSREHYASANRWYTFYWLEEGKEKIFQTQGLGNAVKEIKRLSGLHPDRLYRFCRRLTVLGFFKEGKLLKVVHIDIHKPKPPPIPADAPAKIIGESCCVRKPSEETCCAAKAPPKKDDPFITDEDREILAPQMFMI